MGMRFAAASRPSAASARSRSVAPAAEASETLPAERREKATARGVVARVDAQAGDGGDGGQRLATEAHGRDDGEPFRVGELRGGVPLERERGVGGVHPATVVDHPHERESALLHLDLDLPSPGIERVLDQLLHDRGRALDHLAGGDLVHEAGWQEQDARHATL